MSKVLRVDRSFRGKRIISALKAAKMNSIRIRSNTLPAENKAQDNRHDEIGLNPINPVNPVNPVKLLQD